MWFLLSFKHPEGTAGMTDLSRPRLRRGAAQGLAVAHKEFTALRDGAEIRRSKMKVNPQTDVFDLSLVGLAVGGMAVEVLQHQLEVTA